MAEKIIEAKGIFYTYDKSEKENKKYVLNGVDFSVEKGEFVSVVGHNGSGKSTLAKILNLILIPSSGDLYLFGKKIEKDKSDDEVYELRKKIGMVFQNPDNQIVATIIEEDVAFGPENLGVPASEIKERVKNALEIVDMTSYSRHSINQVSGGQKQRVAIAGIIAIQPEIIIFDESTAMLDPIGRREVMKIISNLKEMGTTIIFITHHMDEAAMADRVVVLDNGTVLLNDTPKNVFSKENEIKETGIDIPQAKLVLDLIKEAGFDIDNSYLDEFSASKEIYRFLEANKK